MQKDLFKKILKSSKENGSYINIYTDQENTDKFSMCIVISFDDDFVLTKKVSPEGNYDGFSILLTEYIYCIEFEDNYIKRKTLTIKEDISKIQLKDQELLVNNFRFDDTIDLILKQKYLCSINLIYDRGFIGYVEDFDGENIIIRNIDDNNNEDGFSVFKVVEIEKVNLFSTELTSIMNLK